MQQARHRAPVCLFPSGAAQAAATLTGIGFTTEVTAPGSEMLLQDDTMKIWRKDQYARRGSIWREAPAEDTTRFTEERKREIAALFAAAGCIPTTRRESAAAEQFVDWGL